ncbi:hypothetical protein BO86DRAFT_197599 [Aspergillus japonicus CBS 114.51]|uniref:Uncharacterized protein n=1 Tax=Aspergillus japonicus CBS 114.51 TaxID=1448312 RepID=A0A8T8WQR9_ASPJA|nr:hypothetical protein BO86DRAFT_197599 [Aspergillus japonicus CBS 114.51]RAH78121.1 hypothetical protein BO86DRAFT_197599 [Aspergillus japonicus CBS 114.51]
MRPSSSNRTTHRAAVRCFFGAAILVPAHLTRSHAQRDGRVARLPPTALLRGFLCRLHLLSRRHTRPVADRYGVRSMHLSSPAKSPMAVCLR